MGQIVAAVDLGTSKSIALVAQKDYSGKLSVLKTETIDSKNAIRRGRIYNSVEASEIISKLIWKLNNKPEMQVEKIYVGIGGQSLHTQLFSVKRTVESGIITQQLLDSIKEEGFNYKPEFEENLGIFSCEFYADGQLTSTPRGTMASVVEARFQLVVGNPCLKRNLEAVFNKKDISVAGYFISPLATAEAVLTQEEKESGCALIEWGEGVTYVSVYKNKVLRYMATLPLGGLAITKDIRSLNVLEEEAEALKIKYGRAVPDQDNDESIPVNKEQSSSWKIKLFDLNSIIEARVDEIVKNIWNLIKISGYSQELNSGIVITGGGASLRDLPQFIKNQTGKEVRLVNAKVLVNQIETYFPPANSCVVGLVALGKDNCVKENLILTPTNLDKDKENDKNKEREKQRQIEKDRERQIEKEKQRQIEKEKQKEKERQRQIEKEQEKERRKKEGDIKIMKGVKIFINKGLELFKDEDFEDTTNKPVEEDNEEIQPEDNDFDNNKN